MIEALTSLQFLLEKQPKELRSSCLYFCLHFVPSLPKLLQQYTQMPYAVLQKPSIFLLYQLYHDCKYLYKLLYTSSLSGESNVQEGDLLE